MPIRSKLRPLWLCLMLILPVQHAGADERRTTRQMSALSAREADRTVRHDLLSILRPTDKIHPGMFIQLHGVGLSTEPFGTPYENVCRRDDVTLWYTNAPDTRASADAPLQPYSVEASPAFLIVGVPRPKADQGRGNGVWQSACGVGHSNDRWFSAKDAFHALQGALVLNQTLDAVRSGRLKAQRCPDIGRSGGSCEHAVLAAGGVSDIDSIQSCAATIGSVCYEIDLGGQTKLTITAHGNEDEVAPGETMSVAVEEYIIVT